MSTNAVEKKARDLSQLLRLKSRKIDKSARQRIRLLLSETFAALEARPLDGARCLELAAQMDREIAAIEDEKAQGVNAEIGVSSSEKPVAITKIEAKSEAPRRDGVQATKIDEGRGVADETSHAESAHFSKKASARIADSDDDATRIADSGENEPQSARIADSDDATRIADSGETEEEASLKTPELMPFTKMIHLQIRCFVRLRAGIKSIELGAVSKFAEKYGESVQSRVDKFLNVLSKGEADFATKVDQEKGYRDDLIPDMPDRNLVLHPRRKKRN